MITKIVWDHTAIGSPVIFHPSLTSPLLALLKEQTIGLGCRYLSSIESDHGTFVCTLGVDRNGEGLVATVDRFDERTDPNAPAFLLPGDISVPCTFHRRAVCLEEKRNGDFLCWLKSLHRNVSSSGEVSLSRCISLSLHIHLVGPNCKVGIEGLSPSNSFRAVPVSPLPLLQTALSESMFSNPGLSQKTGFLTMESSQKILLLLDKDPRIKTCPLIGIWVSCVSTLVEPTVWAACLRFLTCPDYDKRVVHPEQPFLLVIYSSLHSGPEFYDCTCSSPDINFTLLEGHCQLTVTKVPSFTSRVCAVELLPVENKKTQKTFQAALAEFHKDLPPLPYCDSAALAFPSDSKDYPRATPKPPVQNFTLKPSVPDLSLLSEVSRFSAKSFGHLPDRFPLGPLNYPLHQSSGRVNINKELAHSAFHQIKQPIQNMQTGFAFSPLNTSAEPLPRTRIEKAPKEITFGDLRDEVSRMLEPQNRMLASKCSGDSKSVSEKAMTNNPVNTKNQNNVIVVYATDRKSAEFSRFSGVAQNGSKGAIGGSIPPETVASPQKLNQGAVEKNSNKSILFHNIHELLKQKDTRMSELQEQVKELLEMQKKQFLKPTLDQKKSEEHEPSDILLSRMDHQNEQLTQLKEQILLLLDNQVKQQDQQTSSTSKSSKSEISKCSVGVMTSIAPEMFSGANRQTSNQALPDVSQQLSIKEQSFEIQKRVHHVGRITEKECHTPVTRQHGLESPSQSEERRPSNPNVGGGARCECHCGRAENKLSIEDLRLNATESEAMSPEPSLCLDLEQLQPPMGFSSSVDCSLPLGASVSLFEDRMLQQFDQPVSGSSELSDQHCFRVPGNAQLNEANLNTLHQPFRRGRTNRLSLPTQRDRPPKIEEDERRISFGESSSAHRILPSGQKWEGSMLLPKLNYQTLCLSDESESESTPGDELSLKYLATPKCTRPGFKSGAFRKNTNLNMISFDAHSKNMSFATREYLEKYGLVS